MRQTGWSCHSVNHSTAGGGGAGDCGVSAAKEQTRRDVAVVILTEGGNTNLMDLCELIQCEVRKTDTTNITNSTSNNQ